MSPFSKLPVRTVVKGLSQYNVSRATFKIRDHRLVVIVFVNGIVDLP